MALVPGCCRSLQLNNVLLVDYPTPVRVFKHNKNEEQGVVHGAIMLEIPGVIKMSALAFPFMLATANGSQINRTRIVEALIVAAVTAGATSFITQKQMEVKMDAMAQSVARMELAVNGAIATIERRRELRDQQLDAIKADINKLKVDMEKKR